jgi:hypothetical protein
MIADRRDSAMIRLVAASFALLVWSCISLTTCRAEQSRELADAARFGSEGAGWREGIQCGPNALYLFLRLHGWKGTLEQVRKRVPVEDVKGCSLATLYRVAGELGMPVRLVKTDIDGLQAEDLPAIVHIDNPEYMQAGHFSLFMGAGRSRTSDQKVTYLIDPIQFTENEVSAPQFERTWTAYALVRRAPGSSTYLGYGLWATLGITLTAVVLCAAAEVKSVLLRTLPEGGSPADDQLTVSQGSAPTTSF